MKKLKLTFLLGFILIVPGYLLFTKYEEISLILEWVGIIIFGTGACFLWYGVSKYSDKQTQRKITEYGVILGRILSTAAFLTFLMFLYFGLNSDFTIQWISLGLIILLIGFPFGLWASKNSRLSLNK